MSEVKPCPFCGSEPLVESREHGYTARCLSCGIKLLLDAWNRRASPWRPWSELEAEEHGEVLVHGSNWRAFWYWERGAWRESGLDWEMVPSEYPTHWMPIPPLPENAAMHPESDEDEAEA